MELAACFARIICNEAEENRLPMNSLALLCPAEENLKYSPERVTFRDRLTQQQKDWREEQIIIQNLGQLALPLFIPIVKEYGELINPTQKFPQYPEDFPAIAKAKFTPTFSDTVAQAYENFLQIRVSRKYRNYQDLLPKWHQQLENIIFKDSGWCDSKRNYLKMTWKKALFRKPYPRQRALKGRHPAGHAISLVEAFRFIHYFSKKFMVPTFRTLSAVSIDFFKLRTKNG